MNSGQSTFYRHAIRIFIMCKRHAVDLTLLASIALLHGLMYGQTQPPLTLDQVQSLLRIGAPDPTIAYEITLRGLAFQPSAALLKELKQEGAGVQTLAAMSTFNRVRNGDENPREHVDGSLPKSDLTGDQWGSMASVFFFRRDWEQFESKSREALRRGGSVSIRMMKEHRGWTGEALDPVQLTITPSDLIIKSHSRSGKTSAITAPLSTIRIVEVTDKSTLGKEIVLVVRHLTQGTYLLHIDIQKGKRVDDRTQLFLATTDSQIVKASNGVNYLASPTTSRKALEAVAGVIGMGVGISESNTR